MLSADEVTRMKITFFVNSIVGYVANPAALYTRALAHGLALRGNEVRIVESRQNDQVTRTLREAGSRAARHVYDAFTSFQYTSFEPRSGARLLEWVTREVALIDVAVAVGGLDDELCRWLANITRENLTRTYLTWEPDRLSHERASFLEIDKFDLVLSPSSPLAELHWKSVERSVAQQDRGTATGGFADTLTTDVHDPLDAARSFEHVVSRRAVI